MKCPLCVQTQSNPIQHIYLMQIQIYHCQNCDLIFKDPQSFLNSTEEKARYDLHLNSEADQGYLEFLSPVVNYIEGVFPLQDRNQYRILDYGSGPNPVLATLLRKRGFWVDIYDPYFAPDLDILESTLEKRFTLIVSTEVVEHFHKPEFEFSKIKKALKEDGELVLMTQLHPGTEKFKDWWYPRDPTHVVFYSKLTMNWIQKNWNFKKLTVNPALKR